MPRTRKLVGGALAAALTHDAEVRNGGVEILDVLQTAHLEAFARDRDDRNGNVLEILLSASGRDHDLLETFLSESGVTIKTAGARQCRHDCGVDFVDLHETPNR
jgi:hypothetical protein